MTGSSDTTVLVPTLRVQVSGDTVTLDLVVANAGTTPVTVTFGTAQRYDFAVRDEAGEEVWRWSADRMFAQALSEEAVPAGGALEYHEVWQATKRGRFRVEARLVSVDRPLELEAEFEVPDE